MGVDEGGVMLMSVADSHTLCTTHMFLCLGVVRRNTAEHQLTALGYQGGYHGNQGFLIGTHGPGTQAGTQGKPCFAGAENLSKPDIQNLKKPEA